MSITPFGLYSRNVDPFFGLNDVLGDYDRQMRHMTRELSRMENQFLTGPVGGNGVGPLASLTDRNTITPRIVEENGQKLAQYNFDIRGFNKEDVHIKTSDGRLIVSAKHEDLGEDHHAIREFRRMVALPEGMQIDGMKSRLNNNGVLTITAPYTAPAIEEKKHHELPIQHEKSKALK